MFSIRLGREEIVFICGYKMVKEALVMQADNFVDRPYSAIDDRIMNGNNGSQDTWTLEMCLVCQQW